jgi:hypothetical protein
MKVLIIILIAVGVCLTAPITSIGFQQVGAINVIYVKGHEYIVASNGTSQSGICIIHSESCTCHIPKIVHDTIYVNKKVVAKH